MSIDFNIDSTCVHLVIALLTYCTPHLRQLINLPNDILRPKHLAGLFPYGLGSAQLDWSFSIWSEPVPSGIQPIWSLKHFLSANIFVFGIRQLFDEALSQCRRIYGRYHWLTAGIHHNIGVAYQYHENYRAAYDNYKQSYLINYVICGPKHSETMKEMKAMRTSEFKSFHCDAKVKQEAQKQM